MCHTEPLLLINDQKSQILERYIFGQYTVGADHNIHHTALQLLDRMLLLRWRPETAQQVNRDRKILHPLCKCIVMLLCKYRCRNEIYDLLALLHCLKRCTDGNFCLAIADIPTDETIHDLCALHIMLRLLDGTHLILGLLKRKHFFKFTLPDCIRSIDIAFLLLAHGIQTDQFLRDLFDCPLYTRTCTAPLLRAECIQFWLFGITACVFLDQIQLGRQNIQI